MNDETDIDGLTSEFRRKLDSDAALSVADVEFLLARLRHDRNDEQLTRFRDRVDERLTGALGHAVYTSILERFLEAGVIDEVRADLTDPSIDPEGFEKIELDDRTRYRLRTVGDEASVSVGYLHPPEKRPSDLWTIQRSLLDYLFCSGRGFHIDAEMIYDYETDYRELLRVVVERTDYLSESALEVTCSGDESATVTVEITTNERSYDVAFEQRGDWLRTEAFEPVRAALRERSTTDVYYRGGNDGWLLVMDADEYDLLERYLRYPAEYP